MFIVSCCSSMYYITFLIYYIFLSIINNISISVNNSYSTSVFLNMFAMLILVPIKIKLNQVHVFQYIYFESFQIHLQVIIHHFECTNHDIHLDCLFQSFIYFFACLQPASVISSIDYCKNLLYQVTMFHQIFSSYPCIHMNKHLFLTLKKSY